MRSRILRSPLVRILFSGLIGLIAGGAISYWICTVIADKPETQEFRSEPLSVGAVTDGSRDTLDRMHEAFFGLKRLYWALEGYRDDEADVCFSECETITNRWNQWIAGVREGPVAEGEPEIADPMSIRSVHAAFIQASEALTTFYQGKSEMLEARRALEIEALTALKNLAETIESFEEVFESNA